MKNKHLVFVLMAVLLLCGPSLLAADTNDTIPAELNQLVAKINTKLAAGETQEADFTDNFKEFDTIVANHKNANPKELAQVLLVEAQLYLQAFDNPEKTLELFKRIKRDYPSVQIGGNTDEAINSLKPSVAKWKIRNALAVGTKFPEFTAKDANGKTLSLADYKSNVVLIDFWATWCPPCRAELPNVLKTYQKYHDQGFDIIGVSLDNSRQKLQSFVKEKGMTWRQCFDGRGWQGRLVTKFGLDEIPSTFLLNGQGIIVAKNLRGDALGQAVAKAVAKK